MKIKLQALASTLIGLVVFAAVLFWPAGTLDYWQAWVFTAVFLVTTLTPSVYLAVRHPEVLARRMKAGPTAETRPVQRLVITAVMVLVLATFVLCALDHRFGWSHVPTWLTLLANLLVGVGLGITQLVIVQNNFAGASITVEPGQTLVSTGLYGVVRHPMYSGAALMMFATPPALDSLWGLAGVAAAAPLMVARILDEEKMLTEELPGYREYTRQVRARLIPGVW
ncbi:membrane protein [Mycolicibacterium parafortuitum]|uniref:Membrane protein n=1 Tax=Mycolicibacterium parafortuitum TaxID=39692 RepID=A0A7I7U5U7_MYCPF|nr:isoprenylcysteine carboxylmethyltransferase family protein [Mycolicibacterium parafortuitum]PQD98367.1 hypothetical protein CYL16_23510 [Mycobacterium sp. EPG1]BBY75959.1 membrane protein [Mycolicibacterium parafortuitum]